jgi:hypothetical protein
VKTVVASLWPVDDAATRWLMARYYEGLWRDGLSARDALRRAQQAYRAEYPGPRGPEFWAPWVVSGEPPVAATATATPPAGRAESPAPGRGASSALPGGPVAVTLAAVALAAGAFALRARLRRGGPTPAPGLGPDRRT